MLKKWDRLPEKLKNEAVRPYYDILRKKGFALFCKRVFDLLLSAVLIVLLSPLFLILAICIKLDSRGPVFFRQERLTQYGKIFRIHKFRTMCVDAEKLGTKVTIAEDPRITRVGRFIRKARFDEICQLFDIFAGNMSFVGTRPEVRQYVDSYTDEMYATLLMPAGLTSYASIAYKDEARLLDAAEDADKTYIEEILPKKMEYNLAEIKRFSIWRDIRLLFMTFFAICGKEYS